MPDRGPLVPFQPLAPSDWMPDWCPPARPAGALWRSAPVRGVTPRRVACQRTGGRVARRARVSYCGHVALPPPLRLKPPPARGRPMTVMRWARLQEDVDCKLRRGAWYRVTHVAGLEAIVDVNRRPLAVPSYAIEIVATPPRAWSVVPLPRRASRLAAELGNRYGVCPNCRHRARLEPRAPAMT